MEKKITGLFIHYDNGDIINIKDLPRDEYEEFLDKLESLRIIYKILIDRQD